MKCSRVLAALVVSAASPISAQSHLGAWKVAEITESAGPDAGRHSSDVQPGLLLFTGVHYSITIVDSYAPRAQLRENPTAEELAKVWGPFTANAGTYQIKDSTLSYTPIVAKNPGVMDGTTRTLGIRVRADTLWLTTPPAEGPQVSYKWLRIERLQGR